MQPSWFTVPWVQFQTLPGITGLTSPSAGQMGALGMSVGTPMSHPPTLSPINGLNGLSTLNGIPGINGFSGMTGINLAGINGLNNINGLSSLGSLNGLAAGPGGLVALPGPAVTGASGAGPPGIALQLRRPHQPVPPPLAALIRGKKVRQNFFLNL